MHLEASGSIWMQLWKTSGRHLEDNWEVSGKHLGGIWEVSGRHLEASGKHLEASGRYLGGIWEAWAPKVSPRWSEGSEPPKSVTPLS